MENNCSTAFEFHKDSANNFIRMDGRLESSILRQMYGGGNRFYDVTLFGSPPPNAPDTALEPIRAHTYILAGASQFFLHLFTDDGFTDSHQSEYKIELIDHASLGRIVEFMYMGQITTGTENQVEVMCGVLTGADYLLIKNLAGACDTFLAGDEQVKPENCVTLHGFARKYRCLKLLHATSTFIANNLPDMPEDA